MKSNKEVLKDILILDSYFRHSKKFFRFIEDKDINKYETQPYNLSTKAKFIIRFNKPITKELQMLHSKVGHYLNQNYLIRLYELLKANEIAGKNINKKLIGSENIEDLHLLRNKFAHRLGKYEPNCKDDKNLLNILITRYKEEHIVKDEFPISQDKTIRDIMHGIVKYLNGEVKPTS
jgi:hypothetical protein